MYYTGQVHPRSCGGERWCLSVMVKFLYLYIGEHQGMDVSFVIRRRLEEFGLDQRDLARAAEVTESYISQLLTRKKAPPAPNRTDIYTKMDKFLKLPEGEWARLAGLQRREQVKRQLGDEPAPLFEEVRVLILRKCKPEREKQMRAVFE